MRNRSFVQSSGCGLHARSSPPFPSPWMIPDWSSPTRVRFAPCKGSALEDAATWKACNESPNGAILGTVELVDCVEESDDYSFFGAVRVGAGTSASVAQTDPGTWQTEALDGPSGYRPTPTVGRSARRGRSRLIGEFHKACNYGCLGIWDFHRCGAQSCGQSWPFAGA